MIRATISKIIFVPLSFHANKLFEMMETIARRSWLSNQLTVWQFPTTFQPHLLLAASLGFFVVPGSGGAEVWQRFFN
jgi:hypothetical protein